MIRKMFRAFLCIILLIAVIPETSAKASTYTEGYTELTIFEASPITREILQLPVAALAHLRKPGLWKSR